MSFAHDINAKRGSQEKLGTVVLNCKIFKL